MRIFLLSVMLSIAVLGAEAQIPSLQFAKNLGGPMDDIPTSMTTDGSGNIYITGHYNSSADLDPSVASYSLTSVGQQDIFISKLDANGNFLWAKGVGGTLNDFANAITLDPSGNIIVAGRFNGSVDFDPGNGTAVETSTNSTGGYVLKLDTEGNFLWVKTFISTAGAGVKDIECDLSGNIFGTGYFSGAANFDPGISNTGLSAFGSSDIFVFKLSGNSNFSWVRQQGGVDYDCGNAIEIDNNGNLYVTGFFSLYAKFDPAKTSYNIISAGVEDVFMLKLSTNGDFVWVKKMGGTSSDIANSLALDEMNNIYFTGTFSSTSDFGSATPASQLTSHGSLDSYLCKLDKDGYFLWVRQIGGAGVDEGNNVYVDNFSDIYIAGGCSEACVFQSTGTAFTYSSNGGSDAFIGKYDKTGNLIWNTLSGGPDDESSYSGCADGLGGLIIVGKFSETVDFDPRNSTSTLTSSGQSDVFIQKLADPNPLGLSEGNNRFFLSVFPNPTATNFTIKHNLSDHRVHLKIVDLQGRVILDDYNITDKNITINLSDQANGVYLLELTGQKSKVRAKIIRN